MTNTDAKNLISQAKNICVIPAQTNEPESLTAALALFYTLQSQGKNVNLVINRFPEKLNFLAPSLDAISLPQNFVISIPRSAAQINQIYYERNDEQLKIHLTAEKGQQIKKEHIAFYVEQPRPDTVITVGVKNFQQELQSLDSLGFLLGAPIINVDNSHTNTLFGTANLLRHVSLTELLLELISLETQTSAKKETATCLLAGLMMYYDHFKSPKTDSSLLKLASYLIEQGADYPTITRHLNATTAQQMEFLSDIFKNLRSEEGSYVAFLNSESWYNFGEPEAVSAMEKISGLGIQNNLLVLWQSHASDPTVKGFFYSQNSALLSNMDAVRRYPNWVFIAMPGADLEKTKEILIPTTL